jgi:hypothetical protein
VQVVHTLTDGGALRLTVARWLTPKGDPIQGIGLAPDMRVAEVAGSDAPLEQAVDLIRRRPNTAQRPDVDGHLPQRGAHALVAPGRTPLVESALGAGASLSVLDLDEAATVERSGLM